MYRVIMIVCLHNTSTLGQVFQQGQCVEEPENIVADLDIPAFMGTWYQLARIPNTYEVGNCSMTSFKLMRPGSGDILVVEKELTDDGRIQERYGNITFSHGRFNSNFDKIKPDYYWVAGVQYDDYALLYSCENVDHDTKQVWGWMLSRMREMSPVAQEGLPDAAVAASDLREVAWTWTDQGEYCERHGTTEGRPRSS